MGAEVPLEFDGSARWMGAESLLRNIQRKAVVTLQAFAHTKVAARSKVFAPLKGVAKICGARCSVWVSAVASDKATLADSQVEL